MPVVGRQQKNLCSYQTNVLGVGGQQKNQPVMGSLNAAVLLLPIKKANYFRSGIFGIFVIDKSVRLCYPTIRKSNISRDGDVKPAPMPE